MIDITKSRDGALTQIVAVCTSDDLATQAEAIFDKFGRIVKRDGLVISTTCKRMHADSLVSELERLSARTAPTAKAASTPAGHGWNGKRRELILANIVSERLARAKPGFSGLGEEFIGSEIHGEFWGERVRYAYYD